MAAKQSPQAQVTRFKKLLDRVQAHAATNGGKLSFSKPWSGTAVDALSTKVKPSFGTFQYPIPPSYKLFLTTFGSVTLKGRRVDPDHFTILSGKQIVEDAANLVHVPEGVSWEPPTGGKASRITTSHLVPFATEDAEARWCFDTTVVGADGELPVYFHHQDEPEAARSVVTGEWLAKPEGYPNFTTWFEAYVNRICMG